MVVVLPEPLTPTTRTTNGFAAVDGERLRHRLQELLRPPRRRTVFTSSAVRILLSKRPFADGVGDAAADVDAEIGADQRLLDLVELSRRSSGCVLPSRSSSGAAERRRGALQAAGEAAPPALLAAVPADIRSVLSFMAGRRDTGSAIDTGRDRQPPALPRRADADHRQACAGLPCTRALKAAASLEDYFDALRFGLPRLPALAHRLDKETSAAAWCSAATARRWPT